VFFGGVAAMLVSDNLKSGITKACFYEPEVNRSYAEMAAHYGTAIVPARPYKPRDKAKVEVAVLLATRWIIAKLRNRRFFSITELNDAIRDCVTTLNERVTRHLGASRRTLFDDVERTTLKPLPAEPYVYAEWKQCRAGLDYHVEVEKHFYSVPHTLNCQSSCELAGGVSPLSAEGVGDGPYTSAQRRCAQGGHLQNQAGNRARAIALGMRGRDAIDRLVANGTLHAATGSIFSVDGKPLSPYRHQSQAILNTASTAPISHPPSAASCPPAAFV
jgi:hypothetical protein